MRLAAAGYRSMAWKNGQGISHEIAREPAGGDSILWRLSIAEIATDGDFSLFPGCDRTITLIEGAGMELEFDDAPAKRIDRRFMPFNFAGDWHCRCRLIAAPIRDFNLIVDRSRLRAETLVLRIADAPVEAEIADGRIFVYCAEGEVKADGFTAEAGDTLNLRPGRHIIAGSGALAIVMRLHMRRGR